MLHILVMFMLHNLDQYVNKSTCNFHFATKVECEAKTCSSIIFIHEMLFTYFCCSFNLFFPLWLLRNGQRQSSYFTLPFFLHFFLFKFTFSYGHYQQVFCDDWMTVKYVFNGYLCIFNILSANTFTFQFFFLSRLLGAFTD